jgi:polar amino acid transport system substrate-binding protein
MNSKFLCNVFAMLFLSADIMCAQPAAPDTLVVGIKHTPPFVIIDTAAAAPRGFSIELIEEITRSIRPSPILEYHIDPDLTSHLTSVQSGIVDCGIAATTISSSREAVLDFSQPFFQDRLALAVPKGRGMLRALFSTRIFRFIAAWQALSGLIIGVLLYLFICANLIWLVERGQQFDRRWLQGIGQGMWWTIVTMSTVGYGDFVPKRPLGRVLGVGVIFSGIILFGIAIASLSSFLTVNSLQTGIRKLEDIGNRHVAVIEQSFSEQFARARGLNTVSGPDLPSLFGMIKALKAAVLIHDASLIQYYLRSNVADKNKFLVITQGMKASNYGIAFAEDSPLKETVDRALLELMEGDNPAYRRIYDRWFKTE